jgi:SAM-dependent methyltransferase
VTIVSLACPSCRSQLRNLKDEKFICECCSGEFPIVDRKPLLLSDDNLLFSKETALDVTSSGFGSGISAAISRILPEITFNKFQDVALDRFINSLPIGAKCLVIGAGEDVSINTKISQRGGSTISTDVILSDIVDFVCDITALPFSDNQFDAVIVIAVLEHVVEPKIGVDEISRVLKKDGLVFSAIPFMQQVHMGCFDFQRYTLLGHRWLFASFELIELSPTSGAGSALLWSITSFLQAFSKQRIISLAVKAFVRIFFFWIKYFDLLQNNAQDFALGSYFVGRNKKSQVINHRELIGLYNC